MIVAIVGTSWLLLEPRRSAAGPIFLIMSVGMVMMVPVDLGVQDSLRGFLGSNFSEESGLEAGDVEEKQGVWILGMFRNHFLSPIDPRLSPDFAFGATDTTKKISSPNSIGKQWLRPRPFFGLLLIQVKCRKRILSIEGDILPL